MNSLISIRNLKYTYGDGTEALRGLNLEINQGEKLMILGINGSGKSTLFLCLNGILKPQAGEILFEEKPYKYDKKSLVNIRKNIGIVFQDPETQLFCVDVYEEVSFGPTNLGYSEEKVDEIVNKSLKAVEMDIFKDKPAHFLSYGQKKRVSIAAVLAMEPKVVIFDEPTAALDPKATKQVMNIIEELSRNGVTVIISTHDVDFAYSVGDKIAIMKAGIVKKIGKPIEVFQNNELISESNLELPNVLRIYNKLNEKGIVNVDKIPRNMMELENII